MTEPLMINDPVQTRLVRVEAFGPADAFSKAFAAATGAAPPAAGTAAQGAAGPVLWAEPRVWLASGDAAALETALSDHAAVADVSGAWRCIAVTGTGWRDLLMVDGVFDAEDEAFAPGCLAATVLHHAPVMLHVTGARSVSVYVAPSYAHDLLTALRTAARR